MKANELRIGNLVTDSIGIVEIGKNGKIDWGDIYNPIPITEEWLIKLGFKKNITTDLYPTFSYDIVNVNDSIVYVLNYGFVNHIKYVHQLQNLYFALTENELNVTL